MDLIERAEFLTSLQKRFKRVAEGEGHCILVTGEAGIGKTSLVKTFCKDKESEGRCKVIRSSCDALFSPPPLAPVYDIIYQLGSSLFEHSTNITERSAFFTRLFYELANVKETPIVVIEDIHWADEASLDFIKFLARRITRLRCLLILTYRDDEIRLNHPLRNFLGQLQPDSFTRIQLNPLSKEAVEKMALNKGYKGEDVYSISGGNPFYVNEILASYSLGIPDNIKDSILSVYNRMDEETKHVWQILSVLPTGFEIKYLEKMEPSYAAEIHNCLDLKILIPKDGEISFKHELYRRTIENSLSPLTRISLNKSILDMFRESFEQSGEIERIVHHAKNANDYEAVVQYAPMAARQAAALCAHIEASRLYQTAIEYYQGKDKDELVELYESYSYECYLTNQVREAIIYSTKALAIWKEKNDTEKTGNCLRFLSRLWWFNGNGKKAEDYASQAIEILSSEPDSKSKALAFSNMSQLKMLCDEFEECIEWGEKAIEMARRLEDDEILCHALNNIGTVQARDLSTKQNGIKLLQQSLEIAEKNSFHDHAGRAYANLANNAVRMKDQARAKELLEKGIQYCEERSLESYTTYLLQDKAILNLEMGNWNEAWRLSHQIMANENHPSITKIDCLIVVSRIKMRRGEEISDHLLFDAKLKAVETKEPQRIVPVMIALLEYEWITGKKIIENKDLETGLAMAKQSGNVFWNSEFNFWLFRSRKRKNFPDAFFEGYLMDGQTTALKAASIWKKLGYPYEEALALFEADDSDKRKALELMQGLGAHAVYEKMKFEMRASGIKNIPRGLRKSTKSNPAHLTERELDVLQLLKEGLQNKEIADRLYISPKTVDHHISSIFFKLEVNTRAKAVQEAIQLEIIK